MRATRGYCCWGKSVNKPKKPTYEECIKRKFDKAKQQIIQKSNGEIMVTK